MGAMVTMEELLGLEPTPQTGKSLINDGAIVDKKRSGKATVCTEIAKVTYK